MSNREHREIVERIPTPRRSQHEPLVYAAPFPAEEYRDRLRRLREDMAAHDIDVTIISDAKSVYWLAAGKAKFDYADNPIWLVVPVSGKVTAVARRVEHSTFERSVSPVIDEVREYRDGGVIVPYDPEPVVAEVVRALRPAPCTVGIAERYVSVTDFRQLEELVPGLTLQNYPIEHIRAINSPAEISYMQIAANANERALRQAIREMYVGINEWEFMQRVHALHVELLGNLYGGSSVSAQTCQIGRHAHDMHPRRQAAEMQATQSVLGDIALLEPGVFVKDLVGCMMRTVYFGDDPPDFLVEAAKASAEGLQRAMEIIRPGVTAHEADAAIRAPMAERGLDVQSRTGYGCGIGWDVGNAVSLTPGNPQPLETGHTLHVICHSYGQLGFVGMSEQIVVTDTGCETLANEPDKCPHRLFLIHPPDL